MHSLAEREFRYKKWKQYCIDKNGKQCGATEDYGLDLHFYMMAMHMTIQKNTDFQYI